MSSPSLSSAPTPPPSTRQARLAGPSVCLDRRINAVRGDLADLRLADRVVAPRYSAGVEMRATMPEGAMRAAPDADAIAVSSLLYGESFTVFDVVGGWSWGQCAVDGYVGWIANEGLSLATGLPTHRITAADALVFAAPSIKSAIRERLPLNAQVVAVEHDDPTFLFLPNKGTWLHRRHVAPLTADPVELAGTFIGTPYAWGGRSRAGVDCSGLTQAVLLAHGVACPRDSDQQRAAFMAIDPAERRRGDLAFFPGHVGIFLDSDRLIHANAYWMTTLVEPLAAIVDRLRPEFAEPLLGVARPPCRVAEHSL